MIVFRVIKPYPDTFENAELFLKASQRAVHFAKNYEEVFLNGRAGSGRYGFDQRPVLYTAKEQLTAVYEMTYHYVNKFLKQLGVSRTGNLMCASLVIEGSYEDLSKSDDIDLVSPDYTYCKEVAARSCEKGLKFIVVPSARKEDGICVPVFCPTAVAEIHQETSVINLDWNGSEESLSLNIANDDYAVVFDDVYEKKQTRQIHA